MGRRGRAVSENSDDARRIHLDDHEFCGFASAAMSSTASRVRSGVRPHRHLNREHPLLDVRLTGIEFAARDIHLFELRRTDGRVLPSAEAGAHIDLHLPNGLIRQYSLISPDPNPRRYQLGIKRDPASSGGSQFIFDQLKVGQTLAVSEPRNNFPLVQSAEHTVLIAGGIGITPIWAMVQTLQSLKRSWQLHYSCGSRDSMAFLEALQGSASAILHFDDEAGGRFLDVAGIVEQAPREAHFYCCGPSPMLDAFKAACKDIPPEQVHIEYFTPQSAPDRSGGFLVRLARSNREFVIPPGQSILEVLRCTGMKLPFSCEQGICGSCETAVLSGIPDHRDSVLTDSEHASNRTMMICCSGCKSETLVLDL
jgi:ferredoxin-NADP reductase